MTIEQQAEELYPIDIIVNGKDTIDYNYPLRQAHIKALTTPSIYQAAGLVSIEEVKQAIFEYVQTEGCGCCSDYEGHKEARDKIGKMLSFPIYPDGSGYDLTYHFTKKEINNPPQNKD